MFLVSYSHTSQTLNCTSSGGPATNVTWRKDNVTIPLTSSIYQQSQRVADEVTSTYHNLLSITSSNIEDHIGSFSCTVENNRGNSANNFLDINSESVIFPPIFCSLCLVKYPIYIYPSGYIPLVPYSILVIVTLLL